jgi:hypothetical protein
MKPPESPGLVKIRAVPLVQRRRVELCAAHEGRWREILDAADVVSEGRTLVESGGLVYYGSTSVLLPRSSLGPLPDADVLALAAVLRSDPHVRLRALRIAHREATARAGRSIGTLRADVAFGVAPRGVTIAVDVAAHLDHARVPPAASPASSR